MMHDRARPQSLLLGLRQVLLHVAITILAVAIAFSLPQAARYILYEWWPVVEKNPNLLLATEISLASVLVLLLNFAKIVWDNRQSVAMAKLAALAYARKDRRSWLARRRERALVGRLSAARDACILTLTGSDIFAEDRSLLRGALQSAYEVRVLLANPAGKGLRRRVDSLPPDVSLTDYCKEIEASIASLAELRKAGKKVALKFYEHEPLWKVVVLGDHVWVQHFHSGLEVKHQPEYVFALQHHQPREGLYIPFYVHFLEQWDRPCDPEYDFDTNELVYRDAAGNERARAALGARPDAGAAPQDRPAFAPAAPFPAAAALRAAH